MKVTFVNQHTERLCTVLARMDSDKTYSVGDGLLSDMARKAGSLMESLVRRGLITKTKIDERFYEYKLTEFGAAVSANLRSIGI